MSDTSQQTEEREEREEQQYVTAGKAAKMLGTTRDKIARLLKDGTLTFKVNPLDTRQKMIPLAEVERLKRWRLSSVA